MAARQIATLTAALHARRIAWNRVRRTEAKLAGEMEALRQAHDWVRREYRSLADSVPEARDLSTKWEGLFPADPEPKA